MWRPFYQREAAAFATVVARSMAVETVSADETDRTALMARLARGVPLLVYLGHGHARGWTGFRGIRVSDFPAPSAGPPIGCVLSFSCSPMTGEDSFGRHLVHAGAAGGFVGPSGPLEEAVLPGLARVFATALEERTAPDAETLLAAVTSLATDAGCTPLIRALASWRVAGCARMPRVAVGTAQNAPSLSA